jgi:hypothetical protein
MDDFVKQSGKSVSYKDNIKRWIPSVIIFPIALYFFINRGKYGLIDNFNLVIHEAGHFFFMIFGNFIYAAGGTLMQIFFPLFLCWYFWSNNYRTGMQFSLLFLGQNFINISTYAADAQARKLPLLGGNFVKHDWHYLLTELGILQYDSLVGDFFIFLSLITFMFTLLLPLFIKN